MLFPDIRLKNILEVRVVDSINPEYAIAVPALISSLLYEESVFESVESVLMDMPQHEFSIYKKAAAKHGMHAEVNNTNYAKIGKFIIEKALEGLASKDENWLLPFFDKYSKNNFL